MGNNQRLGVKIDHKLLWMGLTHIHSLCEYNWGINNKLDFPFHQPYCK